MSIPGPSNEKVQLNTSYIGNGARLFHVSVMADEGTTLWLVAADTEDQAHASAWDEHHDGYDVPEFKQGEDTDGSRAGSQEPPDQIAVYRRWPWAASYHWR